MDISDTSINLKEFFDENNNIEKFFLQSDSIKNSLLTGDDCLDKFVTINNLSYDIDSSNYDLEDLPEDLPDLLSYYDPYERSYFLYSKNKENIEKFIKYMDNLSIKNDHSEIEENEDDFEEYYPYILYFSVNNNNY